MKKIQYLIWFLLISGLVATSCTEQVVSPRIEHSISGGAVKE